MSEFDLEKFKNCEHDYFYEQEYRECRNCGSKEEYPILCGRQHEYIKELEAQLKDYAESYAKLKIEKKELEADLNVLVETMEVLRESFPEVDSAISIALSKGNQENEDR